MYINQCDSLQSDIRERWTMAWVNLTASSSHYASIRLAIINMLADMELWDIWLLVVNSHWHARLLILLVSLNSYFRGLQTPFVLRCTSKWYGHTKITRTIIHLH